MRNLALPLTLLAATPAAADEALPPPIAQCIQDNAAKVEAAVGDLNQAVDFLVGDVCAEPIAAEQARATKRFAEQQSAHWKKMCDDMQSDKAKKPGTDVAKGYEAWCSNVKVGFLTEPVGDDEEGGSYTFVSGAAHPPAAVALASRLLLDLRLSHMKRQP